MKLKYHRAIKIIKLLLLVNSNATPFESKKKPTSKDEVSGSGHHFNVEKINCQHCMSIVRTEHYTTLHCTSADILFLSPSFNTEEEEVRESPTKALVVAAQECKMAAVSDTAHTHTSTAATSLPLGLAMLDCAVIVGVVSGFKGLSLLQSWKLYARPAL